jgi:hypothetical protein
MQLRCVVSAARALSVALSASAQAELFKCTDPLGGVSYQQTACTGEARSDSMRLPEATPGANASRSRSAIGSASAAEHWSVEQQLERMQNASGGDARKPAKPASKRREKPTPRPRRVQILNAIHRHQVIPGMTPDEVDAALGPPTATKHDADGVRSWSYRGVDAEGKRRSQTVYFDDGRVTGRSGSGSRAADRFDPDQGRWLDSLR